MVQEPTETGQSRRPRSRLVGAFVALSILALTLSTLGVVLAGPLVAEEVALHVTPTVAQVDLAPLPAVSAPTASPAADDYFTAPPITLLPPPPPPTHTTVVHHAILDFANAQRAAYGLPPLTWSSSLASRAKSWSNSMAASDDAEPGNPGAALAHNPNRPSGGENVACNYAESNGVAVYGYYSSGASLSVADAGWLASAPHLANILDPRWTKMGGAGTQSAEGVWYWTENFQ